MRKYRGELILTGRVRESEDMFGFPCLRVKSYQLDLIDIIKYKIRPKDRVCYTYEVLNTWQRKDGTWDAVYDPYEGIRILYNFNARHLRPSRVK